MLNGGIFVLHVCGDGFRFRKRGFQGSVNVDFIRFYGAAAHTGHTFDCGLQFVFQNFWRSACFFDEITGDAFFFVDQSKKEMLLCDLTVAVRCHQCSGILQGFHAFLCVFLQIHSFSHFLSNFKIYFIA